MIAVSLASHQAALFVLSLDAPAEQQRAYACVLNAEERARAERYIPPDVRRRFSVCRGYLRHLLGQNLGIAPAQVKLRTGQWGKPTLAHGPSPELHFNVSHSGEWALILLAHSPVGVDIELPNDRIGYRAIASQVLSPREAQPWQALSPAEQEQAMLDLWVCKEAVLKALGLGIAEGLRQVTLPVPVPTVAPFSPLALAGDLLWHLEDDGSCRTNHWIDPASWRLQMLPIIPQARAAVCTPANIDHISLHQANL